MVFYLQNEYTDWEKAVRSPLSSRDATLAFLSDGHTASSLIKLGYLHSLNGGRSYFIHFKHRTLEEEYPQVCSQVLLLQIYILLYIFFVVFFCFLIIYKHY